MVDNSAQSRVAKLLQDLVQAHLPPDINPTLTQWYVQYSIRILSSRIQPIDDGSNQAADADHLKTLLLRKIQQ